MFIQQSAFGPVPHAHWPTGWLTPKSWSQQGLNEIGEYCTLSCPKLFDLLVAPVWPFGGQAVINFRSGSKLGSKGTKGQESAMVSWYCIRLKQVQWV